MNRETSQLIIMFELLGGNNIDIIGSPGSNRFDFPWIIIERAVGTRDRLYLWSPMEVHRITIALWLYGGLYNNSGIDIILSAYKFRIQH